MTLKAAVSLSAATTSCGAGRPGGRAAPKAKSFLPPLLRIRLEVVVVVVKVSAAKPARERGAVPYKIPRVSPCSLLLRLLRRAVAKAVTTGVVAMFPQIQKFLPVSLCPHLERAVVVLRVRRLRCPVCRNPVGALPWCLGRPGCSFSICCGFSGCTSFCCNGRA